MFVSGTIGYRQRHNHLSFQCIPTLRVPTKNQKRNFLTFRKFFPYLDTNFLHFARSLTWSMKSLSDENHDIFLFQDNQHLENVSWLSLTFGETKDVTWPLYCSRFSLTFQVGGVLTLLCLYVRLHVICEMEVHFNWYLLRQPMITQWKS